MRPWKTLKAFISSTFDESELKREDLAKVFRKRKKEIFSRRLNLITYDLRWNEGEDTTLVEWALDTLVQCQYFIAILGPHYGWIPPLDEQGNPNQEEISLFEMEIKKALQVIKPHRRIFFVPSEKEDRETPPPVRGEPGMEEKEEGEERGEEEKKLAALREYLEERDETLCTYSNPEELLELLAQGLKKMIDEDFPTGGKTPRPFVPPPNKEKTFREEKTRNFVGREKALKEIRHFTVSLNSPNYLAIYGARGRGKSAIIGQFISQWMKQSNPLPLVVHHFGLAGKNRTRKKLMEKLGQQLRHLEVFKGELPRDPLARERMIQKGLENTEKRFILILDGLDEMEERGQNLNWLSRYIPPNVRVVVTTRESRPLEALKTYQRAQLLELPPLSSEKIGEIIEIYREKYQFNLSDDERELLLEKTGGNPLYLKTALEEILTSDFSVSHLGSSMNELFDQIIDHLEKTFGETSLQDFLGFLSVPRHGIPEEALKDLLLSEEARLAALKNEERAQTQLTDNSFLKIKGSLKYFIVSRGGNLDFYHPHFGERIKKRLGADKIRDYHRALAHYLFHRGFEYPFALEELPYQLQWGQLYEELLKILSNIDFLEIKAQRGMVQELVEDFKRALYNRQVPLPRDLNLYRQKGEKTPFNYRLLFLLYQALEVDLNFLRQHPTHLFQCLWNRCFWFDSPQAESHYKNKSFPGDKKEGEKISSLVELWRKNRGEKFRWIQSRRPLENRLDSRLSQIFRGHEGKVTDLDISPEGQRYLSCSSADGIRVWLADEGECISTLSLPQSGVLCASYHPQKKIIASGWDDHYIRLWDWESGECLHTLGGHQGAVHSLLYLGQSGKMASASADGTIRIWSEEDQHSAGVLIGHSGAVHSLAADPQGERLVSASSDGTIRLWNIESEECLLKIELGEKKASSLSFHPLKMSFAASFDDHSIRIWNGETGEELLSLEGHEGPVDHIDFSSGGDFLASCSADKTIRIWELSTGECTAILKNYEHFARTVKFSPQNFQLLSGGGERDGTIRLWNLDISEGDWELVGHQRPFSALAFSPSGHRFVTGGEEKKILLWDRKELAPLADLTGHETPITTLVWKGEEEVIASGSQGGKIGLWDLEKRECTQTFADHEGEIRALVFSLDNKLLASGSEDKTIKIWDLREGKLLATLIGHEGRINHLAFHPEGNQLASASEDGSVRIWDLGKEDSKLKTMWKNFMGRDLFHLDDHQAEVYYTGYSFDGTKLYSASHDGTIRIWDPSTGQCLKVERSPGIITAREEEKNSFLPFIGEGKTGIQLRDNEEVQVFFPYSLEALRFCPPLYLAGGSPSGYLYFLEVKGVQKDRELREDSGVFRLE